MDLSFLDKSSDVTPALVRLYDSHALYKLANEKTPTARVELTQAVTDLLAMDLSLRESELIADVLIGLLRQAEKDLREAISERLSIIDNVPLRVVLQMANDEIDVARPMLKNSNVLGDLDLIYIIKSKTTEYWQSVAERKAISDHVINILAETEDIETGIKLVQNKHITLNEHALGVLASVAQRSEDLAQPLLRREEVTAELANALYDYVGEELKSFINKNYTSDSIKIQAAIDETVAGFKVADGESEFYPSDEMLKAADNYKAKSLLTEKLMLAALQRGQISAFVAQFSRFSGLEPQTVIDILTQKTAQGLAVACKALNVEKANFVSMFLLTNRMRNEAVMVDVKDMTRAVEYFNRVDVDVARDILNGTKGDITHEEC